MQGGSGARAGIIVAVAVIGLAVVAGGFAYGLHRIKVNNQAAEDRVREDEEKLIAVRRVREKREADEEARKQAAVEKALAAPKATEIPTVFLTVNSVSSAEIVARYGDKPEVRGVGSLILPVPQGTVVHLAANAAGYEPMTQDVPVNASTPVSMILKKAARKAAPKKDGPTQVEKGDDIFIEIEDTPAKK